MYQYSLVARRQFEEQGENSKIWLEEFSQISFFQRSDWTHELAKEQFDVSNANATFKISCHVGVVCNTECIKRILAMMRQS